MEEGFAGRIISLEEHLNVRGKMVSFLRDRDDAKFLARSEALPGKMEGSSPGRIILLEE